MKVTFTTNAKSVEYANYILAQAIDNLLDSPSARQSLGLSVADILKAKTFRKQMIKGFLKSAKRPVKSTLTEDK